MPQVVVLLHMLLIPSLPGDGDTQACPSTVEVATTDLPTPMQPPLRPTRRNKKAPTILK
jgi:hypothetical protein